MMCCVGMLRERQEGVVETQVEEDSVVVHAPQRLVLTPGDRVTHCRTLRKNPFHGGTEGLMQGDEMDFFVGSHLPRLTGGRRDGEV